MIIYHEYSNRIVDSRCAPPSGGGSDVSILRLPAIGRQHFEGLE